jgi:hypothetical protein
MKIDSSKRRARRSSACAGASSARAAPGFYMPLRSAPYLAAFDAMRPGVRVFDDTAHWHRGQIDGLPFAIENFADFAANPPASVFVMSLTFGDVCAQQDPRGASGRRGGDAGRAAHLAGFVTRA